MGDLTPRLPNEIKKRPKLLNLFYLNLLSISAQGVPVILKPRYYQFICLDELFPHAAPTPSDCHSPPHRLPQMNFITDGSAEEPLRLFEDQSFMPPGNQRACH